MNANIRNGTLLATNHYQPSQYRMSRLQVFNWGTFSGIYNIPISKQGFLFIGRSGTGKTTLLDAFSALLVPPRWVDFNAAAKETEKTGRGRDRNLVSYIRGAWAERKDDTSGEIATSYLRPNTTWSALALTYRNTHDQIVTLAQILYLRGKTNGLGDVKRQFLIFDRSFDLAELKAFGNSNLDVRKLKQLFPKAFIRDEFPPYGERFRRLLGIESEKALRLLHKTQSAKNLGDLNIFLREFMLDEPKTFEVAKRLVNEFEELKEAHQSVVTAREQIETLAPARKQNQISQSLQKKHRGHTELLDGIDVYTTQRRINLLGQRIEYLRTKSEGLQGEVSRRQAELNRHKEELRELEQQHRKAGGDRVENWQVEKANLEERRNECLRKRAQVETACKALEKDLPDSPQQFATLRNEAQREIENRERENTKLREQRDQKIIHREVAKTKLRQTVDEVRAMERQPSNIPSEMLSLRQEIAETLNVSENTLPFVGELIQVKQSGTEWQGAIERVLRGFALSLLVDESRYLALSSHIDGHHLKQHLVYYRTHEQAEGNGVRVLDANSLVHKIEVKECDQAKWLYAQLRSRFDYACVDSVLALRRSERAVTKEGHIKHSQTCHEKDDRRHLDDRFHWVLGFDNRDKLTLYRQQAEELENKAGTLDKEVRALSAKETERNARATHCQTIVNLQWKEIDDDQPTLAIKQIEQRIHNVLEGNITLKNMVPKIAEQEEAVKQADRNLRKASIDYQQCIEKMEKYKNEYSTLRNEPLTDPLSAAQQEGLEKLFNALTETPNLDNLYQLKNVVERNISEEIRKTADSIGECEKIIEKQFNKFLRHWPAESGELDASLDAAPDFFAKLNRLETDGLPAYEQRFLELRKELNNQSLAALSRHLKEDRKEIEERMAQVNDSLARVPFNKSLTQTTFLQIDCRDKQLPIVREFLQEVRQALSHTLSDEEDREVAETHFLYLSRIVQKLSSDELESRHWRKTVLDVRLHIEFIGRETDESGNEIEVYRSGSGKSGGQRQKLATTCLAAALRYQLGGNEDGMPQYAPVVLDEAFDKADNEFTSLAMDIFVNFGFQMIVATPLKSVMTLEPFIGGACYVDIRDRNASSVLMIEHDEEQQRLNLPEDERTRIDVEVPR